MMKLGLPLAAVICLGFLGVPTQSHATVFIYGVWSDPVLAGNIADALTGHLTYQNNTATAVDSISPSNTISWGSWLNLNNQVSCGDIAPTPCSSSITFTGAASIPANQDSAHTFQIGTIAFSNGTSTLTTLIFGATLTFYESNSSNPIGSDFVSFESTANDPIPPSTDAKNADYITLSGLAGQSFNVLEGTTAVGGLNGYIDDLVVTGITALDDNGFVGNSPTLPTGVPEPASIALLGAALAGLGLYRRRRKTA